MSNQTQGIRWENPPAHGNTNNRWQEVVDALKERPTEWALIVEDASVSTAAQMRRGLLAAFRPVGAFQIRTVTAGMPKTRCKIYARYIREVSE